MRRVEKRIFDNIVRCLPIILSAFLTACNPGASNSSGVSDGEAPGGVLSGDMLPADTAPYADSTSAPAPAAGKPEWVYVPERIEIRDERADYDAMRLIGDTVCYISMNGEGEDDPREICRYALSDRKLTGIPIDWQDDGQAREISCYAFDGGGNVCLIANVYSADYSQFRRFLYKFDREGNNIFFRDITEQLGRGTSIGGMSVDGQGRIYVFNPEEGIWLYTDDGSYHGTVQYGFSKEVQVIGTVEGEDGRYCICIRAGDGAEHCALAEVDFEKKQLAEPQRELPAVDGVCTDSSGQYDLLLYDHTAAYGYDLSTQKKEELFVWQDSDVSGYDVQYFSVLEDGRYFCAVEDWLYGDRSVVLFTRTRAEEAPQRREMVLAGLDGGMSDRVALAMRFNRGNSQYRITVKSYGSLTELYNAILAREPIDIVDLSGVNIKNLCRQEVFEDLSPYLDESETLAREDFVDGILKAYTFDGVLVGIPESFRLRSVVGDRDMLGDAPGLTLEGLLSITGNNPGAMPFDGINREEIMQYLMMFNEETFIDWETGECRFDSDLFKAVLELVKRFPESAESAEEEVSLPTKIQNGDVLFAIADMTEVTDFRIYGAIFGETAAGVGFPTADGRGGTLLYADNAFGIVSVSENKSGAWEFVESVLQRKYTEGMDNKEVYGAFYWRPPFQYPSMQKAFMAITDFVMERDRNGKWGTAIYSDGWTYDFHAVTWEEIDAIRNLIPEATPYFSVENSEILNIINEEAAAYYSGQKEVDDVTDIIQNRAQIYVSENR